MIKIRVSYSTEIELAGVVRLLSPVLKSYKVQQQKGKYKRAYIELKEVDNERISEPYTEQRVKPERTERNGEKGRY